jgi:anaerobic magnesium-protoporphyrin IX monomethyl ester cyclase
MERDLLLINPPITLEERYGSFASVGSQAPPLGLCYLAASARNRGYSVEIVDAPALDMDLSRTMAEVGKIDARVIGLTASTVSIYRASELAKAIKQSGITAPLIIGGPHVSSLPRETLEEFSEFDFGVINEGEFTVLEMLACLKGGGNPGAIPGVVYREENKAVLSPPRNNIEDLDSIPYPAWDLLPRLPKYYKPSPHSYLKLPSTSLMSSRGCNGSCTFCARPFMGEKYRAHSADYTVGMIDHLVRVYGIRDIMFYDDNFLLDKKRVVNICEALLKKDYTISWSCLARPEISSDDLFGLIKKAGCWQIAFGIESGDQGILETIRKKVTVERMSEVIRKTNEAGIHSRGYFMIGCPGETKETIEKTTRFIRESGLKDFHVTFCTPMPGAELFQTAHKYGTFDQDWKKLGFWEPVFIPRGMTREQLVDSHKRMYRKFYLRPAMFLRYFIKLLITNPRSIVDTLKAGLYVAKYSLGGYIKKRMS